MRSCASASPQDHFWLKCSCSISPIRAVSVVTSPAAPRRPRSVCRPGVGATLPPRAATARVAARRLSALCCVKSARARARHVVCVASSSALAALWSSWRTANGTRALLRSAAVRPSVCSAISCNSSACMLDGPPRSVPRAACAARTNARGERAGALAAALRRPQEQGRRGRPIERPIGEHAHSVASPARRSQGTPGGTTPPLAAAWAPHAALHLPPGASTMCGNVIRAPEARAHSR